MADVSSAVSGLSKNFSGRLLLPGDIDWETARRVHNGLVDKRPALIAQCLGAADIAAAVRFAREQSLEIAVRGGGHNVSGRGTIDDGIVIDLSPLKYTLVDPKARTARVGGGTLWGHLNRETQAHGLATTGGVVSTTGVAGLTLGGGLGWLSPKFGNALDNLLGVEIVLADGRIARASADENPDLFWAVRGGGGNFGAVSSFEFRLHPLGPMATGGLIAWPAADARETLRLFRDLADKASDDVSLVAALMTAPDGVTKIAAMAAGYFGPSAVAERVVKPIRSFGRPIMDTLGPITYEEINTRFDASLPRGARNYWKSQFCEELSDAAIDAMVECQKTCPSPMSMILIEHFHGAATRIAPVKTAFALRARGFNALVLSQWSAPDGDTACIRWARETFAALGPFVRPSVYVNYLDQDDTGAAALALAYGSNVQRLKSIKAKYDPQNVFHVNVNIPPEA
ncbi:MAG TPA: FAD-binding oxidoreductase [Casimicrobiaceae bacterium]|nr:FAD-binding oxidoreductase [Casimicrobiaceae bacterium]